MFIESFEQSGHSFLSQHPSFMRSAEKDILKSTLNAKQWRMGKWEHVPKDTHLATRRAESQMLAGRSSREILKDVLSGMVCSQNWKS